VTNGTCSCMAGRGRVILAAGGQGGDSRGSISVPWCRPRVPQVVGRSGSSRTGVVRWLPHRRHCVPTRSTPPAGSAKPVQQMPVAEPADAVPEMIAYGQVAAGTSWTSSTGRPPVALDRERQVRKSTGSRRARGRSAARPPRLVEVGGVPVGCASCARATVATPCSRGEHDQADASVLGRCLSALAHRATLRRGTVTRGSPGVPSGSELRSALDGHHPAGDTTSDVATPDRLGCPFSSFIQPGDIESPVTEPKEGIP
jgi:hypothetical protein